MFFTEYLRWLLQNLLIDALLKFHYFPNNVIDDNGEISIWNSDLSLICKRSDFQNQKPVSKSLNDAHQEKLKKLCFTESSTRLYLKRSLADVFAQSVKFCTVHCHILMSTDVWTRWFINPWSNRQKMDGCSFQQRLRQNLAFVLTQENTLSSRFHFKVKRKSIGSSKKRY